jgi:hypothetical protein
MTKKRFRLCIATLIGLACYFLALSALLVVSGGISEGRGFGAGSGKTWHSHDHLPGKLTANLSSHGKSRQHGSRYHTASTGKNEDNPCLTSGAACSGNSFDQATDGPAPGSGPVTGDSIVTNGKSGTIDDHYFHYPTSFESGLFGGGGAILGLAGSPGENGGSSQNGGGESPTGTRDPTDGTPSFAGPGPGNTSLPIEPDTVTFPLIPQVSPTDPPGLDDPLNPIANPPPGPPPPPGPTGQAYSVPEPSTFWLFLGSLAAIAMMLGVVRHARPSRLRR